MFRIITEATQFREHVLLRDGESVLLRMATPADVPAVEALLRQVSPDSLRLRFMGAIRQVPRQFVEGLCTLEPRDRACMLAVLGEGTGEAVIGFGDYVASGVRHTAEVAFLVADAHQGRGVTTLLLEKLAGIAAGAGFVGFEADVLFENQRMLSVFRDSGFVGHQVIDGGSYHLDFPVSGAAALRERAELRERTATAASLERLLRPRVVAVVGASRRRGSFGGLIFRHLLANNFLGTVYPVNRSAEAVQGVRAYPSLAQLPEVADLVVIAVPATQVQTVAEDALRAGARGLVVVASGFAEVGSEGEAQQRRLVEAVRAHGARLVGPNCLGLLNTDSQVRLDASLAPTLPPVGRIGFFSHSAALGIVILQHAAERGLGFSTFVSAGNRADVSGNDLLQYWEEDPATDVAMLYLEAFGNPRRFARVARRVALRKPVLCVKSARSHAGRAAARVRIGAHPLVDVEVDALFQQAGVIRVDTLEELFDTALLLAHQPLPRGNTAAILGNSGGAVTIAADACEAREIAVGGVFDLGSMAGPEDYRRALQGALADDRVDAAIVIFLCVSECEPQLIVRGIRRGVLGAEAASGLAKPVLLCLMGTSGAVDVSSGSVSGRRTVFPSYRFPEAAVSALGHVVQYSRFRRQPAGRLLWYEDVDPGAARSQLEPLVADAAGTTLSPGQARELLACFGVPVAPAGIGARVVVALRQHPDFGPLLSLRRSGRGGVERITPLTDQDARAMLAGSGVRGDGGELELLGRLSQMIEELPWLAELRAAMVSSADGSTAALAAGLRIVVSAPRPVAGTPTEV